MLHRYLSFLLPLALLACGTPSSTGEQTAEGSGPSENRVGRLIVPEPGKLVILGCEKDQTSVTGAVPEQLAQHIERLGMDPSYEFYLEVKGMVADDGGFTIQEVVRTLDGDPCTTGWPGTYGARREVAPDAMTGKLRIEQDGTFLLVTVKGNSAERQDLTGQWVEAGNGMELRGSDRTVIVERTGPLSITIHDARPGTDLMLERID